MKNKLVDILQALYDQEVNFTITTFWDGGFTFVLGDEFNGFKAVEIFHTFAEGVHWLRSEAHKQYGIIVNVE